MAVSALAAVADVYDATVTDIADVQFELNRRVVNLETLIQLFSNSL